MLELLDNFRLQDAVDIGIVAFLLYSLIELIRGTRAARMLIGLGVIVLIYLSSRLFGLYTLDWILANLLSSVLLVIVIIFQHDIRRVLVQVGSRPFFARITAWPGRISRRSSAPSSSWPAAASAA